MRGLNSLAVLALICSLASSGCRGDVAVSAEPPLPDRAVFDTTIYPLLLRDCGFSECHGAERRFFQAFGPGRNHLEGKSGAELTARERQFTYDRARSMLVATGGDSILESPLLTKPLELSLGGAAHEGVDRFGRNVFQSVFDPRYVALAQWAVSAVPVQTVPPVTVTPPPPGVAETEAAGSGAVAPLHIEDASIADPPAERPGP
jgi:hypothetical protein